MDMVNVVKVIVADVKMIAHRARVGDTYTELEAEAFVALNKFIDISKSLITSEDEKTLLQYWNQFISSAAIVYKYKAEVIQQRAFQHSMSNDDEYEDDSASLPIHDFTQTVNKSTYSEAASQMDMVTNKIAGLIKKYVLLLKVKETAKSSSAPTTNNTSNTSVSTPNNYNRPTNGTAITTSENSGRGFIQRNSTTTTSPSSTSSTSRSPKASPKPVLSWVAQKQTLAASPISHVNSNTNNGSTTIHISKTKSTENSTNSPGDDEPRSIIVTESIGHNKNKQDLSLLMLVRPSREELEQRKIIMPEVDSRPGSRRNSLTLSNSSGGSNSSNTVNNTATTSSTPITVTSASSSNSVSSSNNNNSNNKEPSYLAAEPLTKPPLRTVSTTAIPNKRPPPSVPGYSTSTLTSTVNPVQSNGTSTSTTPNPKTMVSSSSTTLRSSSSAPSVSLATTGLASPVTLLKGEQYVLMANEVYYRDREKANHVTWRNGKLVFTNFRLIFLRKGDNEILLTMPICMINTCEKVGTKSMGGESSYKIVMECKDFRRLHFNFEKNNKKTRRQVLETCRSLLATPTVKLFAFFYKEVFPVNGWEIYNPEKEYERLGVGVNGSAWRVTVANRSYKLCPTYPSTIAVPAKALDTELFQVAAYRSKGRIPVLSWVHRSNTASITRCSQPRAGVTRRRSVEDEKMINEISSANKYNPVLQIFDARPSANARANQVMGAGTENMANYPNCILTFHNIENIHVMRESLKGLSEACNVTEDSKFLSSLDSSQWFYHTSKILQAVEKMVDMIENKAISILVHCSDGWDRTPQLTSLSSMLLDPYYRSIIGFEVLIEKEFVSFGHQYALRTGHDGVGKYSERSPVFLQFVDCVYQLSLQFPTEFEFNEEFLVALVEESYACRFGTFLFDYEKDRSEARIKETTNSLWSFINSDINKYRNILYRPTDKVLFPNPSQKKFKLWEKFYFRHAPEFISHGLEEKVEELTEDYRTRIKELEDQIARLSNTRK